MQAVVRAETETAAPWGAAVRAVALLEIAVSAWTAIGAAAFLATIGWPELSRGAWGPGVAWVIVDIGLATLTVLAALGLSQRRGWARSWMLWRSATDVVATLAWSAAGRHTASLLALLAGGGLTPPGGHMLADARLLAGVAAIAVLAWPPAGVRFTPAGLALRVAIPALLAARTAAGLLQPLVR
ncbi:MAG: hypothetical protein KIT14_04475 [bacterium]|nr:hypothetical protein [bacterium]